ncbi:MAG TPA: WbqC family protein [Pyrinomonadaceae bacterium]|nr:WbqC family protein [Pyrinomonadaceae bacterium]
MLVAIHQPEHMPWLGFFEKMLRADLFVMLDDVQFSKGDFQNRNRVKGAGGAQWLTVPVVQRFPQRINEVEVAGGSWRAKHWKTLASCYAKARHFETFAGAFEDFYRREWSRLSELNVAGTGLLARALGVETKVVFSSSLAAGGRKSELVLNICKAVGASAYYSGRVGSTYLDAEAFRRAGIDVVVQEFEHPTYEQQFMKGEGFVPNLSALDLLFNCGPDGLELLRGAGRSSLAYTLH